MTRANHLGHDPERATVDRSGGGATCPAVWYVEDRRSTFATGDVLIYLGSGTLVLASLAVEAARAPGPVKLIAWLGKHSYSVYLWHMAILEYLVLPVKSWGPVPAEPGLYFVFFFVTAWCAGVVLVQLIENQSLKMRDRLFPSFQKN